MVPCPTPRVTSTTTTSTVGPSEAAASAIGPALADSSKAYDARHDCGSILIPTRSVEKQHTLVLFAGDCDCYSGVACFFSPMVPVRVYPESRGSPSRFALASGCLFWPERAIRRGNRRQLAREHRRRELISSSSRHVGEVTGQCGSVPDRCLQRNPSSSASFELSLNEESVSRSVPLFAEIVRCAFPSTSVSSGLHASRQCVSEQQVNEPFSCGSAVAPSFYTLESSEQSATPANVGIPVPEA